MKDEQQQLKTIVHATLVCMCCFCLGIIIAFLFAFQNNILCDYTSNSYLCKKVACQGDCNNTTNINQWNASVNSPLNASVNSTLNSSVESTLNSSVESTLNSSMNSSLNATINSPFNPPLNPQIEGDVSELNRRPISEDITNSTSFQNQTSLYMRAIRPPHTNIEPESKSVDSGLALVISTISVFGFIGCLIGSIWYIKYKPNPFKNIITNSTASKHIPLTPEELEQAQINPILKVLNKENKNLLVLAIKNITKAVEKDNHHYFAEAITLYDLGVDQLMKYMKLVENGEERFQMAKKIDIYMQRVNYLKRCQENQLIADTINITPAKPLVEKKCVCQANTL